LGEGTIIMLVQQTNYIILYNHIAKILKNILWSFQKIFTPHPLRKFNPPPYSLRNVKVAIVIILVMLQSEYFDTIKKQIYM
jgi:hypothetical protein